MKLRTQESNNLAAGKVCGLQRSWKRILGRLGENKNESLLILENGMDYIQRSHIWMKA